MVNSPGCTSALVQVRSVTQLRGLLGTLKLSPLPSAVLEEIVRMGAAKGANEAPCTVHDAAACTVAP